MDNTTFKEKVKNTIIICAKKYKENFVDYNYLICSSAFTIENYYVINAHKDNFQHLTGVHSLISAQEFFEKSFNGTLSEEDFDFIKKNQSEKAVKGYVREKISVLENTMELFTYSKLYCEECFKKNKVICSFATASDKLTLGFINHTYSTPKSLLKSNKLSENAAKVDLIFKKKKSDKKFNELILGSQNDVEKYYDKIKKLIEIDN